MKWNEISEKARSPHLHDICALFRVEKLGNGISSLKKQLRTAITSFILSSSSFFVFSYEDDNAGRLELFSLLEFDPRV